LLQEGIYPLLLRLVDAPFSSPDMASMALQLLAVLPTQQALADSLAAALDGQGTPRSHSFRQTVLRFGLVDKAGKVAITSLSCHGDKHMNCSSSASAAHSSRLTCCCCKVRLHADA
jgi:hypothetical protein